MIRDCGLMSYRDGLVLQKELVRQRQKDQLANTILILEHKPVITLGARESENKLLIDEKALTEKGIDFERIKRGGGGTAHNPGQVVLYPIVDLKSLKLGVNEYIRELEAIGIELLKKFGIDAQRRKKLPGLWVDERKIGSIGVRIKRWVTYHGMAVNIKNDLSIFDAIVPCGIEGVEMTSVAKETGKKISMAEVKRELEKLCRQHFCGQKESKNES